ncbi:MAG TPA: four helix bundle protein [Parafilimonas sp.]|nr:four helix bundle protein [Parafilimonas sp.]
MSFRFEELNIWQRAFKLANEIDLIVELFPKKELFSLSSQIKRAADSVVLNIAEGSTGQTKSEFKRFLNIALRSAIEVVSCLMMANERKYLNKEQFKNFYDEYEILCKMITKFRNSLN